MLKHMVKDVIVASFNQGYFIEQKVIIGDNNQVSSSAVWSLSFSTK